MPGVPKLQSLLKCIQNQFATEQQRGVIDTLNMEDHITSGVSFRNYIEDKLLEDGVPAGLFNIGNTCYANSALQALMVCTPFVGFFVDQFDRLQHTPEQRYYDNGSSLEFPLNGAHGCLYQKLPPVVASELTQAISTLLLLRNQNDSFSPSHLVALLRRLYPQFAVGHQHDAQEFVSILLDRLHEELKYPVLQFAEETSEEDDGTASSTKSDYESCVSLVSEDSVYSLSGEDTMVAEDVCNGTVNGVPPEISFHKLSDGDSAQGSADSESVEAFGDMSPAKEIDGVTRPLPSHYRSSKIVTWRSVIQDLFYGDFAVTIECKACGEVSTRYESFQMLEVSIPTAEQLAGRTMEDELNDGYTYKNGKKSNKPETTTTSSTWWPKWMSLKAPHLKRRVELMACLRNEFKPEQLTGDNRYHCDRCNKATDAVKNIRISRLPEILIIHFKRFKYENPGTFLSSFSSPDRKIPDLVDFPCEEFLDPTMFNVDFTAKYDLRSVISHSGSTLSSGHYTSYVKVGDHGTGKWYMCNDADVNSVNSSAIGETEAYMLFYSRVDLEKDERIAQLRGYIASSNLPDVGPTYTESNSSRSLHLFPRTIFARYDVPTLVSKEWWSKLKWSNMVHRMSSQDLICPHRLFLPGTLNRLEEVCVPVSPLAFEQLVELFDGVNCRLLHRSECLLCAQLLHVRATASFRPNGKASKKENDNSVDFGRAVRDILP